jgi:hypothetical protein
MRIVSRAAAAIAIVCGGLPAQESKFDRTTSLPVTVAWKPPEVEKLWLGFEDATDAQDADPLMEPKAPVIAARELWLMAAIRERFKGVRSVATVEKMTVRQDGASRTATRERGLEVQGSREALARTHEFFDRFMRGSKKLVTIELRIVEADKQSEPGTQEVTALVASRDDWDGRTRSAERRDGKSSIGSPTVLVHANQTAKISFAEKVAYVKDFDVERVQGAVIADPIVGTVDEGCDIELTPIHDPESNVWIISGSIGFSHVVRPIPEHKVKVASSDVVVQVPSVVSRRWKGEVRLASGESVFKIIGLQHNPPGSEKTLSVDVWCRITLGDAASGLPSGQIVDRDDENGNLFVAFPAESVPDDPWTKAPKEVSVFRSGEKIGTARLAGGWVMPGRKHPVIAIYQLAESTPKDGDSVK